MGREHHTTGMTLHLIPLPFADPDDLSLRALRHLSGVVAVSAADRPALDRILTHHAVAPAQIIAPESVPDALATGDVALVIADALRTDHDPLIASALARGVRVEPIPGANLAIAALVLSALPPDAFVYIGRLPDVGMCDPLTGYVDERATLVMTLSAARVHAAIAALGKKFGDRPACVMAHSVGGAAHVLRGALTALSLPSVEWTGEAAIVLGGAPERPAEPWDEARVRAALDARLAAGEPLRLAAKAVAGECGWDRRAVYALGTQL